MEVTRRALLGRLAALCSAALVNHPPVVPSFGYRFDARDRSIVISGDTRPSDNLIKLARGADVLVRKHFRGQVILGRDLLEI